MTYYKNEKNECTANQIKCKHQMTTKKNDCLALKMRKFWTQLSGQMVKVIK